MFGAPSVVSKDRRKRKCLKTSAADHRTNLSSVESPLTVTHPTLSNIRSSGRVRFPYQRQTSVLGQHLGRGESGSGIVFFAPLTRKEADLDCFGLRQ